MLTIHWIDPAAACEYSYLLSALIKSARGFDNALTMPERLDKATRRREPVRAFLHYVEKLSKAKRRGANPRKIAKLGRKVAGERRFQGDAGVAAEQAQFVRVASFRDVDEVQ